MYIDQYEEKQALHNIDTDCTNWKKKSHENNKTQTKDCADPTLT